LEIVVDKAQATIQVAFHTQYPRADLLHLLSQLLQGIAMANLVAYMTIVQEANEDDLISARLTMRN
jgi:hypothetical protein